MSRELGLVYGVPVWGVESENDFNNQFLYFAQRLENRARRGTELGR